MEKIGKAPSVQEPYWQRAVRNVTRSSGTPGEAPSFPRLGIVALESRAGVDTVATALLLALESLGHKLACFFSREQRLDGSVYQELTGRPVYALDPWLLDSRSMNYLLAKGSDGTDLSLIIGDGGLFDSPLAGNEYEFQGQNYPAMGSPEEVARLTQTPQILLLDASRFEFTQFAMLNGVLNFSKPTVIAGFLLNRLDPDRYPKIKEQLEETFGLPVLGFLPELQALRAPGPKLPEVLVRVARQFIDLEAIMNLAAQAPPLPRSLPVSLLQLQREIPYEALKRTRLAYATGPLYSNRNQANLDLLQEMGCELIPVDLQRDQRLPRHLHGFYISGGRCADEQALSGHYAVRRDFEELVQAKVPVLAEGGGYRFLTRGVRYFDRRGHAQFAPMSAAWDLTLQIPSDFNAQSPARGRMQYGYLQAQQPSLLGPRGSLIQAVLPAEPMPEGGTGLCFADAGSPSRWIHGLAEPTCFATPARFHFLSHPEVLEAFLRACQRRP